MANINFCGNLGRDAELRNIGDKQYCVFSVGESRRYKNSSGQQVTETTWFRCMKSDPNGRLASYLMKGVKIYVCGELRISTYQGKDGQEHQDINVWVNNLDFMSGKSGGQQQQANVNHPQPSQAGQHYPPQQPQPQSPPTAQPMPPVEDNDPGLPF